eukprot:gene17543-biopygen3864
MPAPRPRHPSQKNPIARAMPAPRPRQCPDSVRRLCRWCHGLFHNKWSVLLSVWTANGSLSRPGWVEGAVTRRRR